MKQENLSDNYYITSDLALVAAISLQFPIEDIDRSNPYKAQFRFKKNKELENFIASYWREEIQITPQRYFNQIKLVKTRLYGQGEPQLKNSNSTNNSKGF